MKPMRERVRLDKQKLREGREKDGKSQSAKQSGPNTGIERARQKGAYPPNVHVAKYMKQLE